MGPAAAGSVTLPECPAALWRCACVGCGKEVVIPLGALDPIEGETCGLDYDPRTGRLLPVCEGFLAVYVTREQAM